MAKILRYTGDLQAFASLATGTNRTVFGDTLQSDTLDDNINADFLTGWEIVGVNDDPDIEDFSGLGFTLSQIHAYLHQMGVPEWDILQEYPNTAITNRNGVLYVSQQDHTGQDPELDTAGTYWVPSTTVAAASATGTATFTNVDNNISLVGFGAIVGLEVGDVYTVTDTANNNKEFTVAVITDNDNVIVNEAHAGGTTTKSLVNETVVCTVSLLAKWHSASTSIGQGWVDETINRAINVTETNTTGRPKEVVISGFGDGTPRGLLIDGVQVTKTVTFGANREIHSVTVGPNSSYVFQGLGFATWSEQS